jgi:hypothetical protein
MSSVPDNFYGGNIRKDFRRSPQTVVNLHKRMLRSNDFKVSKSNLNSALAVSRELYQFIQESGSDEIEDYKISLANKREIKGAVIPGFELACELLNAVMKYIHEHPKDAVETVASLVAIEQFIEKKASPVCARLWRKIAEKGDSAMRRDIADLSKLERRKKDIDYRDLR